MLVEDEKNPEMYTNEIVCRLMKQQSAPETDIDCFYVNPLTFRDFMAIFKEVVENRIDDHLRWLIRLIKYTKGDAKKLIMDCLHQPAREERDIAKMLLGKTYSGSNQLLGKKEMKKWQQLKLDDAITGFRKSSRF